MPADKFRYEFCTVFPIVHSVRTICSFPPILSQLLVEIAGLEPAASSTPRKRSAKTELYLDKMWIDAACNPRTRRCQ